MVPNKPGPLKKITWCLCKRALPDPILRAQNSGGSQQDQGVFLLTNILGSSHTGGLGALEAACHVTQSCPAPPTWSVCKQHQLHWFKALAPLQSHWVWIDALAWFAGTLRFWEEQLWSHSSKLVWVRITRGPVKMQIAGPHPHSFWFRWSAGIQSCVFSSFLRDPDDSGTALWKPLP